VSAIRITSAQVRQLRRNLKMSQQEFAEHIGASIAAVQSWEQGKLTPGTVAARRKLAGLIESHGQGEQK
jgi:DNA-binding transcriptional regulator YiaG